MQGSMILQIIFIVVAAYAVHRVIKGSLKKLADDGFVSDNTAFLAIAVSRWTIVVIAGLLITGVIGVSVYALWTALSAIFVLVAVGFVALWSVLSNMLCAVLLVIYAPFRVGDEIELIEVVMQDPAKSPIRGRVEAIDMIFTTLAVGDGNDESELRIPNNLLFQRAIRRIKMSNTESLKNSLFSPRKNESLSRPVERDAREES